MDRVADASRCLAMALASIRIARPAAPKISPLPSRRLASSTPGTRSERSAAIEEDTRFDVPSTRSAAASAEALRNRAAMSPSSDTAPLRSPCRNPSRAWRSLSFSSSTSAPMAIASDRLASPESARRLPASSSASRSLSLVSARSARASSTSPARARCLDSETIDEASPGGRRSSLIVRNSSLVRLSSSARAKWPLRPASMASPASATFRSALSRSRSASILLASSKIIIAGVGSMSSRRARVRRGRSVSMAFIRAEARASCSASAARRRDANASSPSARSLLRSSPSKMASGAP